MTTTAIDIVNLGKRYRLGTLHATTLSEQLGEQAKRLLRMGSRSADHRKENAGPEDFWAIRNVDIAVEQGEVVGIIGRNGAGKSTLLKLLSRITTPTEGRISLRGRLASLLEVGTGFHPELSGRENIFLSASIMGMKRREIVARFDEIVEFAEIARFIDTPVKRYSSGMYVRLAFSVAAHLEPEILLVDEVLAVGDANFQKRCLGKLHEVSGSGRTVLFVSHNMNAIESLCSRCIWLDRGRKAADGKPASVIGRYLADGVVNSEIRETRNTGPLRIKGVQLLNRHGYPTQDLWMADGASIEVRVTAAEEIRGGYIGLSLYNQMNQHLFSFNSLEGGFKPCFKTGAPNIFTLSIPSLPLLPASYFLNVTVLTAERKISDSLNRVLQFQIQPSDLHKSGNPFTPDHGLIYIPHQWVQAENLVRLSESTP